VERTLPTVPLAAFDVYAAATGRPELAGVVRGACLAVVGDRFEVCLERLAAHAGDDLAGAVAAYWGAARRFARRPGDGARVLTRRVLHDATQRTTTPKRDLDDEYDALGTIGAVAGIRDRLLGRQPEPGTVLALVSVVGGAARFDGTSAVVAVPVSGDAGWDARLGGPPSLSELGRWVTLEARWAPWRDRARRRLARVTVHADEAWPVPPSTV
jgi:hypothetical protein